MAALFARTAAGGGWDSAPELLSETGLYAELSSKRLRKDVQPYAPQYPLWTDGAEKRRFIHLPPRARIDVSDPDAWQFPVGTKLWKEFAYGGRRVETRLLERTAEGWRFAAYRWNAAQTDAELVPEAGVVGAFGSHDIPGREDCRSCHESRPAAVLGFSALQLSDDRDPLAPHAQPVPEGALTLSALIREGRLSAPLPSARIEAKTPEARAALGYLHGNCGHCHADDGALASVGLELFQRLSPTNGALASTVNVRSRIRIPGADSSVRIAPGQPDLSALLYRMQAQDPVARMPPLGTHVVDAQAIALVKLFITSMQSNTQGAVP